MDWWINYLGADFGGIKQELFGPDRSQYHR
jgi:hypothetical protein